MCNALVVDITDFVSQYGQVVEGGLYLYVSGIVVVRCPVITQLADFCCLVQTRGTKWTSVC